MRIQVPTLDFPRNVRGGMGTSMFGDNLRGRDLRRLGLLIGLVLALAGCGQLGSLQPPVSQQAPLKLPPL
jgi:hypothetical protein